MRLQYLVGPSRADAPECKRGLGFDYFAVHFEQRVNKEIYGAARGLRINDQVAALR